MKKKNNNLVIWGSIGVAIVALFVLFSQGGGIKLSGIDFLDKYNKTANAVLVDVRTPNEFASGHINDAINIDFENASFVSEIKNLDAAKTYFIYCRSGNRSGQAVAVMKANGIKSIYELRGGLQLAPELIQK
ncbi:MAG: rhodanese-like domain-containing protein [Candidatus Paceibacterota bacterium]